MPMHTPTSTTPPKAQSMPATLGQDRDSRPKYSENMSVKVPDRLLYDQAQIKYMRLYKILSILTYNIYPCLMMVELPTEVSSRE